MTLLSNTEIPPHGIDKEAWQATKKLRDYFTKLNNLLQLHMHEEHGWGGVCHCEEVRDVNNMLAPIQLDIKRALVPPQEDDVFKLKRLEYEINALLRANPNPLIEKSSIVRMLIPTNTTEEG